jgi:hypothetical protein
MNFFPKCGCKKLTKVFIVAYEPGRGEAVDKCAKCGQLWYTRLRERMGFDGREDDLWEDQVPITSNELEEIRKSGAATKSQGLFAGRVGRIIHYIDIKNSLIVEHKF